MKKLIFKYLDSHYVVKCNWIYHSNGLMCRNTQKINNELKLVFELSGRMILKHLKEWVLTQDENFDSYQFFCEGRPLDSVLLEWIISNGGADNHEKFAWVTATEFKMIIERFDRLRDKATHPEQFYLSAMVVNVDCAEDVTCFAYTGDIKKIRDLITLQDNLNQRGKYKFNLISKPMKNQNYD